MNIQRAAIISETRGRSTRTGPPPAPQHGLVGHAGAPVSGAPRQDVGDARRYFGNRVRRRARRKTTDSVRRRVGASVQPRPSNSEIDFPTYKTHTGGRIGPRLARGTGAGTTCTFGNTRIRGPALAASYHGRIDRVGDRFRLNHGQPSVVFEGSGIRVGSWINGDTFVFSLSHFSPVTALNGKLL